MKRTTRNWLIVLAVILGVISVGVTVYPIISNKIWEKTDSKVLTDYTEDLEETDNAELQEMKAAATEYNERLREKVIDTESEEAIAEYNSLLNVSRSGIMAYLEIPKLELYIPVYHGTDAETLEYGAGHLQGSSLPIGGIGTHSVIAAHSGMANKIFFSDLDQMEEGDVFYIHVLDETLAYMVDKVSVVLPENTSLVEIEDDQDYCTLVTCTPYGVNTHRLLVRGTRVAYEEAQELELQESAKAEYTSNWQRQYLNGLVIGIGVIAIGVIVILICGRGKRGRHTCARY